MNKQTVCSPDEDTNIVLYAVVRNLLMFQNSTLVQFLLGCTIFHNNICDHTQYVEATFRGIAEENLNGFTIL